MQSLFCYTLTDISYIRLSIQPDTMLVQQGSATVTVSCDHKVVIITTNTINYYPNLAILTSVHFAVSVRI